MTKPITILKDEFCDALVEDINRSQLPFFIVEYILKDILSDVHAMSLKQADEAKKQYEASISAANNEGDNYDK